VVQCLKKLVLLAVVVEAEAVVADVQVAVRVVAEVVVAMIAAVVIANQANLTK
jgi:hypothetical protein